LTDAEDDLRRTGDFIRSLGCVQKVEILPYHDMGAAKWKSLGLAYALDGILPPDEQSLSRARELLTC
jgi:pyruvate formate lyase activating enzyme